MRAFLAVLVLVVVLFAGCASKGGDGDESQTSTSTSSSKTSSSTTKSGTGSATQTSTGAKANTPPKAGLAIANLTGTVPLNVTFALTGTDADGDALSWTLAFGDNATAQAGTALPTNVTHQYTAAGNYTAQLTVKDAKSNATAKVNVTVSASAGNNSIPATYTFTGTATGVHDPVQGEGTGDPIPHKFAVFGPVKSMTVHLAWEVPGADLDLRVNGPSGTERGSSGCANFAPAPFPLGCNRGTDEEATIALAGTADAGEWTAIVSPFNSPQMEYTLTVTFT